MGGGGVECDFVGRLSVSVRCDHSVGLLSRERSLLVGWYEIRVAGIEAHSLSQASPVLHSIGGDKDLPCMNRQLSEWHFQWLFRMIPQPSNANKLPTGPPFKRGGS